MSVLAYNPAPGANQCFVRRTQYNVNFVKLAEIHHFGTFQDARPET